MVIRRVRSYDNFAIPLGCDRNAFFLLRVEFWKTLAQKKGEVLHVSTGVRRFDGICNQPNQT